MSYHPTTGWDVLNSLVREAPQIFAAIGLVLTAIGSIIGAWFSRQAAAHGAQSITQNAAQLAQGAANAKVLDVVSRQTNGLTDALVAAKGVEQHRQGMDDQKAIDQRAIDQGKSHGASGPEIEGR